MHVIYDGECPFCSSYIKLVKLKSLEEVVLVNARDPKDNHDVVKKVKDEGYSLDDGMALIIDGQIFHGSECINKIALLSTRNDWFNKVNWFIFKSKNLSKILYPFMKFGRNTTLLILGKKKIN